MKEYIAKNRISLINHVIGLGILIVGFVLGRYVFFDVHGMKEFPTTLLILGLVVMVISAITSKKVLPYFISAGYIMGFVFGFLFQVTKMDANGVSANNLWVIWSGVYVAFIIVGFLCDAFLKKYGSAVSWKKSKGKKIVIAILAVLVLWMCIGITDFALVHNYRRPLFCICTESMQDGGSGLYSGLGYSFYIEGNFMPEEQNRGVTSYRGYVFGKEVSRGFWDRMDVDKLIYGDMSVSEECGVTGDDMHIKLNSIAFSELAPGKEEIYFSEYQILGDDAWFDYTITYERAAMTVVVGLRGEDGTEYVEEIAGGEGSGKIGGIPAGSYEVFVRNSESNNDYKDTTTETLDITGAMNFVAGQKLQEGISYSGHIEPFKIKEPTELVIICGEEQVTALRGTYSWEYKNEDETFTGIEADSAHPLDCQELMPDLRLDSTTDVLKAHLKFAIEPDEIEVRYWSTDCWNKPSEDSRELEVQAIEVDFVDGSVSTDHVMKLLDGNYIYEVIAKWNSSEEYGGTAYYSFYTVVGD